MLFKIFQNLTDRLPSKSNVVHFAWFYFSLPMFLKFIFNFITFSVITPVMKKKINKYNFYF